MRSYMISFIAYNFILRIIFRSLMRISFVIKIGSVNFNNRPGNPACFAVPAYMIADVKWVFHNRKKCKKYTADL